MTNNSKRISLNLCENCVKDLVTNLQDWERISVKKGAFASGECPICYGILFAIITMPRYQLEWMEQFVKGWSKKPVKLITMYENKDDTIHQGVDDFP